MVRLVGCTSSSNPRGTGWSDPEGLLSSPIWSVFIRFEPDAPKLKSKLCSLVSLTTTTHIKKTYH